MKKAQFIGTHYENGIRYGTYKYLGEYYDVCFNAFYSFKSIREQHKEEQAFIESRQIKAKHTPEAMPPEKVFSVLEDFFNGKITEDDRDKAFGWN